MNTKTHVLILQHPREPHEELGTAVLLAKHLTNSTLRTGLSWPNLKAALGREVKPSEWAVLYLGSKKIASDKRVQFVSRKNKFIAPPEIPIKGIVLLDGTWKQAKSMWWKNSWLLKLHRVILFPKEPSRYGNLRKEPRREALSTLEAVAEMLTYLNEPPEIPSQLRENFVEFLKTLA